MPGQESEGWGWTSYKRNGAWTLEGIDTYVGLFFRHSAPPSFGYERCRVIFAARRPILALRAIVASGQDPISFANQVIN